ncbi:MarR family protein [Bacteriovorax sp. BAL6_X]|uniref:MarR family winged helix-turn-helix transcriptional regulator n=1 Tax=Bacteriovorax sp. BAL6_X TaxID=1201290 RepID=UPI000385A025|nr:MarR family transcriptional regulator [Bacteriovorax sp. BAL6_X]EPZ51697.1 MarR family protein [Bacteriovorax sp. BAL6_X]
MSIIKSEFVQESIIGRMIRTTRILDKMVSEEVSNFKLTKPQFDVLVILHLTDQESVTTTQLADELLVSKANITGIVKRLEAANLIKKAIDENDTRSKKITLTQDGLDLINKVLPRYFSMGQELVSRFSQEEKSKLLCQLGMIEEFYQSKR